LVSPTARPTLTLSSYATARTSRDGCSASCSGPSAGAFWKGRLKTPSKPSKSGTARGKCMSKLAWKLLTKKRGSSTSQGILPGKEELLWVTGTVTLIGEITMHPLRKLRESGNATPAQVSALLAENIVFNSPILVRPIKGREVIAAIFAQSSSTRGSGT